MEADTWHILSMSFQCLYTCFILQKESEVQVTNMLLHFYLRFLNLAQKPKFIWIPILDFLQISKMLKQQHQTY